MTSQTKTDSNNTVRFIVIGVLIVAAFFGAYKFAAARSEQAQSVALQAAAAQVQPASAPVPASASVAGGASGAAAVPSGSCCGGGSTASGGCCGGSGGSQPQVSANAKQAGGVQKIAVRVTTTYDPNVLKLKAGVPAEITFSQAQGCTGVVQSRALGFAEDLTTGAKTVKLGALSAGTYDFECGMDMVHGTIVVQ